MVTTRKMKKGTHEPRPIYIRLHVNIESIFSNAGRRAKYTLLRTHVDDFNINSNR